MQIPIENIYYLLCYAWNKLEEKEKTNVSTDGITNLLDLFAKVLINATKLLLKRGIEKDYVNYCEEIKGIKGKIDFSQTLKSNLIMKQKAICSFDELSSNVVSNRIIVTTIYRLIKTNGLDKDLKSELINLYRLLSNIEQIEITQSLFARLSFNRNNSFYEFILAVCKLIHENLLPGEEKGRYIFTDYIRKNLHILFEEFVRNFYKIEQNKFNVKRENIKWKFDCPEENKKYLPKMETDITLENEKEKIIIDTKFYKENLSKNRYEQEKINSGNLYQIFSYLINQRDNSEMTKSTKGILLYAVVDKDYNLNYIFEGHQIQISTVNLNQNWKNIHKSLLELIECN